MKREFPKTVALRWKSDTPPGFFTLEEVTVERLGEMRPDDVIGVYMFYGDGPASGMKFKGIKVDGKERKIV